MPNASLRRARLAAAVAATALLGLGCPPGRQDLVCFRAVNDGFLGVRLAEQITLEACFTNVFGSASPADCAASDPLGLVAAAKAATLAAEVRACRAGALPAIGYAGGVAANGAASEAVSELRRGLFGLVPSRATGADRACQSAVLHAAGVCADAFARTYTDCAKVAFPSADDGFDLVACKDSNPARVANACEAYVDSAVAASCGGLDVAPLFPGCAGDLSDCARGHARRSTSLGLNRADALCTDVLPGELPEDVLLRCFEPPPPEPIEESLVPLPPGVQVATTEWDENGEDLFVTFTAPDVTGTQLAAIGADGSDFRCLTCGSAISGNLRPSQRLRDGQRLLVPGPNNRNPRWNILECTPSLLDCQTSLLVPIQLPVNPDPTQILQYRVPWVTLDDAWLVWSEVRQRGPGGHLAVMGRLVRDADRYTISDARVIAPELTSLVLGNDSATWRKITQPLEAKYGALRGGRDWVIAGTPSAGHYDTSVLDLTSGVMRRLSHHPDHDEGVRFSRDEEWVVLQTGRTDNRIEFLGQLPRPPFIDWIAFSIHFVGIAGQPGDGISPGVDPNERDCYVDPWLLDRWFERGEYVGQRLSKPADGWVSIEGNAGGFGWSPDGTKIALIDRRWRYEPPATRIRIAHLTSREPMPPEDWVPLVPTPEPTWAIRYEDWRVPNTLGDFVVQGAVSGTATIRNQMGTSVQGYIEVEFDGYSDDGKHVIDGIEWLDIPFLVVSGADYGVDLALTGPHTGSMQGGIAYDFNADVATGEVVSMLDGRVLTGPKTCYDAGLIPLP
jgi:hypothetical protein